MPHTYTMEEEQSSSDDPHSPVSTENGGMRTSLDQGMAAVRRWIHSTESHRIPNSEDDDLADFPRDFDNFSNPSDGGECSLGDSFPSADHCQSQHEPLHLSPERIQRSNLSDASPRQRSLSEPDADKIKNWLYQRAVFAPQRRCMPIIEPAMNEKEESLHRRRSSADFFNFPNTGDRYAEVEYMTNTPDAAIRESENRQRGNSVDNLDQTERVDDRLRARDRWSSINGKFQFVIGLVALLFSILLFLLLLCWACLVGVYIYSFDKSCDVPLRRYFWLVTVQIVLDIYRTDIVRSIFRWDANSNQRIPCRVIMYNVAYLIYAYLVLHLGVDSVLLEDSSMCRHTAPELFTTSSVFVYLSIMAWSTILFGYLVPFCVVAILLTCNGYAPSSDSQSTNRFTVFPTAMSAPKGCVDRLRTIKAHEFPPQYPLECCICMEHFSSKDVIVATECNHVFHKQCCREWLQQARTCPVCRIDIPAALDNAQANAQAHATREMDRIRDASRNHLHHEVVSFLQIIRSSNLRRRHRTTNESHTTSSLSSQHNQSSRIEEGRTI